MITNYVSGTGVINILGTGVSSIVGSSPITHHRPHLVYASQIGIFILTWELDLYGDNVADVSIMALQVTPTNNFLALISVSGDSIYPYIRNQYPSISYT